jgi:SAM-dependent methyltransferase
MASVSEHYDRHLGPVYTWMMGDAAAAMERNRDELRQLGVAPGVTGIALDLGAGPGLYAVPLAELGFAVIALDFCGPLVEELRRRSEALPIQAVQADLLAFRRHHSGPVDLVLCMGDTLTHLPSLSSVEALFGEVAGALAAPGVFVTTFRDYTSPAPQGSDRFILVRADEHRILTCFLEYGEETVTVSDLLHERTADGWRLSVSSYPKLRIDPAWVGERLQALGLAVQTDRTERGMVRVVARRD